MLRRKRGYIRFLFIDKTRMFVLIIFWFVSFTGLIKKSTSFNQKSYDYFLLIVSSVLLFISIVSLSVVILIFNKLENCFIKDCKRYIK